MCSSWRPTQAYTSVVFCGSGSDGRLKPARSRRIRWCLLDPVTRVFIVPILDGHPEGPSGRVASREGLATGFVNDVELIRRLAWGLLPISVAWSGHLEASAG